MHMYVMDRLLLGVVVYRYTVHKYIHLVCTHCLQFTFTVNYIIQYHKDLNLTCINNKTRSNVCFFLFFCEFNPDSVRSCGH